MSKSCEDDVTRVLHAAGAGDEEAAAELLPLVYGELRRLARARMAKTPPGNTLQPTALVHEAYMRLMGKDDPNRNKSRRHFFAAAAQAMRDILVEQARRKQRLKRGGDRKRVHMQDMDALEAQIESPIDDILALDEALDLLATEDPVSAELVKLRYFAGLTVPQAAEVLGVSPRKADFIWAFARSWLRREIGSE